MTKGGREGGRPRETRERPRETERDRERPRETERDRERPRETERDRERPRETERDRERRERHGDRGREGGWQRQALVVQRKERDKG